MPCGFKVLNRFRGRGCRHDRHLAPYIDQPAQNIVFDAEIVGHDATPALCRDGLPWLEAGAHSPAVVHSYRSVRHVTSAAKSRPMMPGACLLFQRLADGPLRRGKSALAATRLAKMSRQRPGIDAFDSDDFCRCM